MYHSYLYHNCPINLYHSKSLIFFTNIPFCNPLIDNFLLRCFYNYLQSNKTTYVNNLFFEFNFFYVA